MPPADLRENDLRVVITGASSWLGQATLALLEQALGDTLPRRVRLFASSARPMHLASGRVLECRALDDILTLPPARYLFLHYAFVTKGHIGAHSLADYARLNAEIAETVEAAARRVEAKGMFLPSSGAVYRPDRTLRGTLEEHPYGYLKLQDEKRFAAMAEETGCRLAAIRVFNLGGPYINNLSGFALSSIIMDVLRGEPVQIKATHPVYRSYVHINDLIELALQEMLGDNPPPPEPYDTAGETVVEVGDLAHLITQSMGQPDHPILRPEMSGGAADRYVGDGAQFADRAQAGGITLKPLAVQIRDTIADLKTRFATAG